MTVKGHKKLTAYPLKNFLFSKDLSRLKLCFLILNTKQVHTHPTSSFQEFLNLNDISSYFKVLVCSVLVLSAWSLKILIDGCLWSFVAFFQTSVFLSLFLEQYSTSRQGFTMILWKEKFCFPSCFSDVWVSPRVGRFQAFWTSISGCCLNATMHTNSSISSRGIGYCLEQSPLFFLLPRLKLILYPLCSWANGWRRRIDNC